MAWAAKLPVDMGGGGGGMASVTVTSILSWDSRHRSGLKLPSLGKCRRRSRVGPADRGESPPYAGHMTCPSCGEPVAATARFCASCGHAPAPAGGDERRIATVLFADLVGFTTLSETRDPEQVKNLVDACFQLLVRDITSFGGQVDKIVGDAIVALFGAPVAHEDDAERAVRAALAHAGDRPAPTAPRPMRPVQLRIGVNTGEVLVGALRAGGDYTAMGDVVNTAQRLETVADPGRSWSVRPPTPPPTRPSPTGRSDRSRSRAATSRSRRGPPSSRCCPPAIGRVARRPRSSVATPRWVCWATPSTPPSSAAAPTCCC